MTRRGFHIERLSAEYVTGERILPAVRDVSLSIAPGQTLGLVGESGSGKTTLALAAIGYLPANGRVTGGSAWLDDVELGARSRRELRSIWGSQIGMVSQNPQGSFNPSLTVGRHLDEVGRRHLGLDRRAARLHSLKMLRKVEMPEPESVVGRYPHQLSGGMLQRAAIAMALITSPRLLILDEPTTALDVTTQAAILEMLEELEREFDSALLYITHNLGVVSQICDRIAVMYAGEMLEEASTSELFDLPLHPYTINLTNCAPTFGKGEVARSGRLANIAGSLPALDDLPLGCVFAPRCTLAEARCHESHPPVVGVRTDRRSACWRWEVLLSEEGRRAALHKAAPATEIVSSEATGLVPDRATEPPAPAGAEVGRPDAGGHLLEAEDVVKVFSSPGSGRPTRAVDGVSLWMDRARTVGLVGESGCGKTTLARVISGLTPPSAGDISLEGDRLEPNVNSRTRAVLRRLQMVFQNPDASLNPRRTVRQALSRPLAVLRGLGRDSAADRAEELLAAVNLPRSYLDRYPAELSGGEKQRVAIARAFAADPDLVICDEPISSLDVSVQGSLMNLLLDLQEQQGTSYLFISHDLAAVQHLSHRIGVMYLGRLVEVGPASAVLAPPYHPYTEALLSAVPVLDPAWRQDRVRLRSSLPGAGDVPTGCRFHPRCPRDLGEVCRVQEPPWRWAGTHAICCHIGLEELEELQRDATEGPDLAPPELAGRTSGRDGRRSGGTG